MQAKLQSKITLFLIKPIYELSETMDIRGPKWALKKKIAARKHATPLGAKPPLSLNPRNAPGLKYCRTRKVPLLGSTCTGLSEVCQ